MGLKDHSASAPAFETDSEDETMAVSASDQATADVAATTAIAAASAGAVAVAKPALKFKMGFADQKDAFPVEAVVGLSNSAPRIKGEQGACYIEQNSLGTKIRMSVESWNHRTLVSAGLDPKDAGYEESKQYIRNSYDGGATIFGEGQSVKEYLDYLKSIGYDKARSSQYIDVWGFVTWTEKKGDVPAEEQTLHLLQASQTSAGAFTAFCTTQGLLQSKGIGREFSEVEVHAEARAKGTLKYTNFSFHVPKK